MFDRHTDIERPDACAITGHRPSRIPRENRELLMQELQKQLQFLISCGYKHFYTGMAQGTDQWAASLVLSLKERYPFLTLCAVLPCSTQASRWSQNQKMDYFDLLARCDRVVTISPYYNSTCMFERNRYLVDHSAAILAVFDGFQKSGTAYTLNYAASKDKKRIIIHPKTLTVTNNF